MKHVLYRFVLLTLPCSTLLHSPYLGGKGFAFLVVHNQCLVAIVTWDEASEPLGSKCKMAPQQEKQSSCDRQKGLSKLTLSEVSEN